jgi:hypothetical protein
MGPSATASPDVVMQIAMTSVAKDKPRVLDDCCRPGELGADSVQSVISFGQSFRSL